MPKYPPVLGTTVHYEVYQGCDTHWYELPHYDRSRFKNRQEAEDYIKEELELNPDQHLKVVKVTVEPVE